MYARALALRAAPTRARVVRGDVEREKSRTSRVSRVVARASDASRGGVVVDRREFALGGALALALIGRAGAARAGGATIVNPKPIDAGWTRFYGEATSSSSYGGYGGNENNFDKFKYYYDVPEDYERDTVNKVEKSTNGTDNRWKSKKNKDAKVYAVTLPGYSKLKADREAIISDLALSDYNLQDAIIGADSFVTTDRDVDGQLYVDYDLVGFYGNIFASITVYAGRLYSVFAFVPEGSSEAEIAAGRRMRDSFATINNKSEDDAAADVEFYKRS
jgi:hypothetical protein